MIQFFTLPAPTSMQVYNGETNGRAWNDPSYSGPPLPADWAANNTEARIKAILQANSSRFAFTGDAQTTYVDAVKDSSTEVLIVLKGIHQFKLGGVTADSAHITVAWFTYLYHMNVRTVGTGSGTIGVAALGVKSATEGAKAVSSTATGWNVAGKKR
jgi:hypothetical protein